MIKRLSDDSIVTNRDLLLLLDSIKHESESESIHIILSNHLRVGTGRSAGYNPGILVVGRRGIPENNRPVNDIKYVSALVAIYHELRHAEQYFDIRHQETDFGEQIAVSQRAFVNNYVYAHQNYFLNPCEIDAERQGLIQAYHYCKEEFGSKKAEELVCKYVNYRIKHKISFVYPTDSLMYDNIVDVIYDMDLAYEKGLHSRRSYDIEQGLKKR